MHNGILQLFSRIGQNALEKSRGYYYPPAVKSENSAVEVNDLSDAEFSVMLQEIDCFSAQFSITRSQPIPQNSNH